MDWKQIVILLQLIFTGLLSFSQSLVEEERKGFRVHLLYSLDHQTYDRFITTGNGSYFDLNMNTSYRLGVNGELRGNANFAVVSGINYVIRKFDAHYVTPVTGEFREQFLLQFIEVPVYAKYYIPVGKVTPFFELGVLNQFKQKGKYENDFLLSGKLGVGAEYEVVKRVSIQLAGEYNRAITNLYDKYFKNEILGIRIGLVCDL